MCTKRSEECMKIWNAWKNTEELKGGRTYNISSNLSVGLECCTKMLSSQNLSHVSRIALFTGLERSMVTTVFAF
jgi:hypothetical protein